LLFGQQKHRCVKKRAERRYFHKANIALAYKNARMLWKLPVTHGEKFSAQIAA
jgi:hypothetical protein